MDDYEKYQAECKKIKKANKGLLNEFEEWLKTSGLTKKTIDNHLANIDFYVNEYLLYYDATEAKDGIHAVGEFLGHWFIRKAMWSNKTNIKGNAASLKKFYTFMSEKGLVVKNDLIDLKQTIKEDMPEWLDTLERFDNPSVEDVW